MVLGVWPLPGSKPEAQRGNPLRFSCKPGTCWLFRSALSLPCLCHPLPYYVRTGCAHSACMLGEEWKQAEGHPVKNSSLPTFVLSPHIPQKSQGHADGIRVSTYWILWTWEQKSNISTALSTACVISSGAFSPGKPKTQRKEQPCEGKRQQSQLVNREL